MHALINDGKGNYYVSFVFGCYQKLNCKSCPKLNDFNSFFIVWNKDKTRLIAQPENTLGVNYVESLVTIVDISDKDWYDKGNGRNNCVDFLDEDTIKALLDSDEQDEKILEKCREADKGFVLPERLKIENEQDIESFQWITSGLHDAVIEKIEQNGEEVHVLFDDTCWGFTVDVWFSGDAEYNLGDKGKEDEDDWWFDSSLFVSDGFVYLTDYEDIKKPQDIHDYNCWFKGRKMEYKVTPADYSKNRETTGHSRAIIPKDTIAAATEYGSLQPWDANDLCSRGAEFYKEGNFKKAVEYYRLSAILGCNHAISNLGYCYLYGRDIEADIDLAIAYFTIAANNDDIDAAYKLGNIFATDKWGKKDEDLALEYYRAAASIIDKECRVSFDIREDDDRNYFMHFPSLCLAIGELLMTNPELQNYSNAYKFLKCAEEGYELMIEDGGQDFYIPSLKKTKELLSDQHFASI